MTRALLGITALAFLFSSPLAAATSPILALPRDGGTPVTAEEVKEVEGGVEIAVKDRSLKDVLQKVQNASGIRFEVARSLWEAPVTATVKAKNWTEAIGKLLASYNRASVYGSKEQLVQVLVLEHDSTSRDVPPIKAVFTPSNRKHPPPAAGGDGPPAAPVSTGTQDGPPIGRDMGDMDGPPVTDEKIDDGPPPYREYTSPGPPGATK